MTDMTSGRHRRQYVARRVEQRQRERELLAAPELSARKLAELGRHGPNLPEAAIRVHAEQVRAELAGEKDRWRKGFTRRRLIAGAGAVGVAALGSQLVTSRYAFAADPTNTRTLVVIFFRGGMDGLSVIVPAGDGNLRRARPNIGIDAAALLPLDSRFGMHPALAPLQPFWQAGQMTAVHAVASPDASRSHFQAQECIERGTATTSMHTGWLDRTLTAMGPGTTFRAIAEGDATPRALVGAEHKLVMDGIQSFALSGAGNVREKTMAALEALYTGFDHPAASFAINTVKALNSARKIADTRYETTADYGGGGFANRMRDVARLVKAKVGLRLATIDVGGWDMHTGLGNVNGGDMRNSLTDVGRVLGAFAADLGTQLGDVTVVTMTEFGRRVAENGNAGTDHGHGTIMMLLGGGLVGGKVHGKWPGLAPEALDNGDLAGANDYRDVMSEVLERGFGIGDVKPIFPDHEYARIGLMK